MRKKVTILFWIFWHQDQRTVLKHLFTINQLLVGYFNFNSFIYDQYKIDLIFKWSRSFSIASDFCRFYKEVSHLKEWSFKKECVSDQTGWQLH